jgi:hypothetical protein
VNKLTSGHRLAWKQIKVVAAILFINCAIDVTLVVIQAFVSPCHCIDALIRDVVCSSITVVATIALLRKKYWGLLVLMAIAGWILNTSQTAILAVIAHPAFIGVTLYVFSLIIVFAIFSLVNRKVWEFLHQ